jgi:hypothetical protein
MRQFTVYAPDENAEGMTPAYTVNFTDSSVVAYPLRNGWERTAEHLEKVLGREPRPRTGEKVAREPAVAVESAPPSLDDSSLTRV